MKKAVIALMMAGILTACGSEPTTSTEKKEEALANINNLKAGDTWKFKAMSFSTEEGQVIDLEDYEVSGF